MDSKKAKNNEATVEELSEQLEELRERLDREIARRKTLEKFKILSDNANDALYLMDRQGRFVYVNQVCCERMGYAEDELMQMGVPDIDPFYPAEKFTRLFDRVHREKVPPFESVHRRRDGTEFPVEVSPVGVTVEGVPYMFAISRDVTEQKKYEASLEASEEDLRTAKEKAEEMTRLKSSLLANMSHEIRTPLTSMLAHASVLEHKLDGDALASAKAIKRGGKRLTETLDAVLTLAQLEGKALEPVPEDLDMVELVTNVVDSSRQLAEEKGLDLRTEIGFGELPTQSDPRCVRRILDNLVGNAIKFTDEGSVVVSLRADDDLVLQVSDTGVGMSEDFLEDLFEEFTQESTGLSRTHEGSGLGLAITRHLVDALGGTIDVRSKKGIGTAFTVRLPREDDLECCQQAPKVNPYAELTSASGDMSVLLVEDNRDIRRILEDLLAPLGDIVVCADAETALEHAASRAFEVIVMDISLPRMSGVQALDELRKMDRHKHTPIIAMTGHALPGDRQRFLDLGFTDYIGKPFSPSTLISILQERVQASFA